MTSFAQKRSFRFALEPCLLIARKLFLVMVAALPIIVFSVNSAAQAQSGTILGIIQDPSGSAIPNATVTVLNVGNGFTRTLTTDENGRYIADTIPTGSYSVTATAPGFAKFVKTGIELNLGSRLEINLSLPLGDVKQEIVVGATAPLLQSQSSEVSNLVSNKEMINLPLNGRTFTSLVLLTPGAYAGSSDNLKSSPYAMRGSTNISVNGSSPQNNSYLVDGIFNRNLWLSTLIMVPTVDSIQEFRVLTSNYSAEYGAAAGAVTLVETKSGTNQFHGDAYEFFRSDKLDANTYFNNRLGFARPVFQRNEFGGTFGGPIVKNKTFFFADYQGIRLRDPQTIVSTVPTAAQRQMILTGDFSALGTQIYDPASLHSVGGVMVRDPFPGNLIPVNRIDPVAQKLIRLLPDPINNNATLNYAFNPKVKQRTDQFDVRMDQNIGASDRLFLKYSFDDTLGEFPGTLPVGANPDNIPIGPYLSAGPSSGPTGGPPFEGGFSGISVPLRSQSFTANYVKVFSPTAINEARFGVIRLTQQNLPLGINFKTADAVGLAGINVNDLAGGLPAFFLPGFQTIGDDSSFPETSAMTIYQLQDNFTLTRGSHTLKFGGLFIRSQFNAFSDFPTRGEFVFNGQFTRPVGATGSATALADFALGTPSSVTRNILNGEVGMRDYQLSGFAQDNWRVTDRLTLDLGVRYELFAPPLEVADRWANFNVSTGKLILAGKNGADRRLRDFDKNNFSPRVGLALKLTSDGKTLLRGGYGISYVVAGQGGGQLYKNLPFFFSQAFPTDQNGLPVITLQNGVPVPTAPPADNISALSVGNPNVWDPNLQTPQMREWSVGVQRELTNSLMLDVSYVGTQGVDLIENVNVNQAFPGAGAPGPRRPLFTINPNVTNVTVRGNFGESSYHSLQARLQQRMSAGLTFTVAYTYSKYLSDTANINGGGNGPPQDARCIKCEWGPMPEDRRHMLVVNHTYELPFGTGRKYASQGVLGHIVGPWDFDGIWTIYSGSHFTPTLATGVSNAAGGGGDRPNQVCNANLSGDSRSIDNWFDTSCYATPAQFTFGNARRGSLIGPNYFNVDLGLQRYFSITERQRLLFRWEMFNAFNRANFSVPNAVIGSVSAGKISNTSPPRIMQVALKYVF